MTDFGSKIAPESRLMKAWAALGRSGAGRRVFSWLLSRTAPYSGSIRPIVMTIEPGRAAVALKDRRRVRNHLHSVHAIALANLGELASGLAMTAALPSHARGIVTRLDIEFLKKARGRLLAVGLAEVPVVIDTPIDLPVFAEIRDADDVVVAKVTVHWRLGPRDER